MDQPRAWCAKCTILKRRGERGGKSDTKQNISFSSLHILFALLAFCQTVINCLVLKRRRNDQRQKKPHTHTHRVFRQSANRHEIKRNNVYICDVHKAFSRTWMSECESARLKWGDMLSLICSAERMKRCSCRRVYSPQNGTNFGAAGSSRNVRELFLLGGFFRIRQKPFFISSSVVCVFHAVENASEWMSTKEAGHSKTLYVLWCVCVRECNYSWRVNFLYDAVVSSLILLQLMNICLDRSRHSVLAMKCSRNVSVGVVWNEKVSRRRRSKRNSTRKLSFFWSISLVLFWYCGKQVLENRS